MQLEAEPESAAEPAREPSPTQPAPSAEPAQPSPPAEARVVRDAHQDDPDEAEKESSRRHGSRMPESDTGPRTDSTPATEPESESTAPESSTTTVTLSTVPATTLVYRDGQSEGAAPLTYGIKKDERIVLRLVKEGYVTQSVVLDGSQPEVRVVMVKQGALNGGQGAVR
jgi:hypothetical protein